MRDVSKEKLQKLINQIREYWHTRDNTEARVKEIHETAVECTASWDSKGKTLGIYNLKDFVDALVYLGNRTDEEIIEAMALINVNVIEGEQ